MHNQTYFILHIFGDQNTSLIGYQPFLIYTRLKCWHYFLCFWPFPKVTNILKSFYILWRPQYFSLQKRKKKKTTGEIFILNLKRFLLREVKGNNTAQFECICVLILSSFSTQEHLFYFLNFSHYYSNVECHYLCLILFRKKKMPPVSFHSLLVVWHWSQIHNCLSTCSKIPFAST